MFKRQNLEISLELLGANPDPEIFHLLDTLYSEPTRFYHDKSHISECLTQFQKYRAKAENAAEIEIAIWFHDAIYDTKTGDNEEKSAELAEERLSLVKVKPEVIGRVVDMILATKTHQVTTSDSKLMVDVDLGILGTPHDIFETYDRNIRKEYSWVPEEIYLPNRAKILQQFLERETIYHTNDLRNLYDAKARENLARKVAQLTSQVSNTS